MVLMQCHYYENDRAEMYMELRKLDTDDINCILDQPQELISVLMCIHPENILSESIVLLWNISDRFVSDICINVISLDSYDWLLY